VKGALVQKPELTLRLTPDGQWEVWTRDEVLADFQWTWPQFEQYRTQWNALAVQQYEGPQEFPYTTEPWRVDGNDVLFHHQFMLDFRRQMFPNGPPSHQTLQRYERVPGCSLCEDRRYRVSHKPSPNCQSGKNNHCTCEVCF
jgi:hypothetical protein